LLTALSNALDNIKEEDIIEIFSEEHTVSQKINFVRESLRITQKLSVSDLFCGMTSRNEIICTFLAVLELMKSNEVIAIQDNSFSSIFIKNAKKIKNLNEVIDE
jgi:segregation and condensation protein A